MPSTKISIVARCQYDIGLLLARGLVFKPVLMIVCVPASAHSQMECVLKRLSLFRAIAAAGLHIEGDNPCELLVRHLRIFDSDQWDAGHHCTGTHAKTFPMC